MPRIDAHDFINLEPGCKDFLPFDRQALIAQTEHIRRGHVGEVVVTPFGEDIRLWWPYVCTELGQKSSCLLVVHVVAKHSRKTVIQVATSWIERIPNFIWIAPVQTGSHHLRHVLTRERD